MRWWPLQTWVPPARQAPLPLAALSSPGNHSAPCSSSLSMGALCQMPGGCPSATQLSGPPEAVKWAALGASKAANLAVSCTCQQLGLCSCVMEAG